jgi:hypothetical protein
MAFRLFTSLAGESCLTECTTRSQLRMLILQTAACVLTSCREYPPDEWPTTGAPGILAEWMTSWSDHGFQLALEAQADLLYAFAEAMVKDSLHLDREDRQLVVDALAVFQEWKNRLLEHQDCLFGPKGVRYPCRLRLTDWSDLNDALLVLPD